jgi:hypothetical protein
MLTIIKEETIDGYKIITYSNGAVVKQSVSAVNQEFEPQELHLSETEQVILQTAINTEYMAALMETTI